MKKKKFDIEKMILTTLIIFGVFCLFLTYINNVEIELYRKSYDYSEINKINDRVDLMYIIGIIGYNKKDYEDSKFLLEEALISNPNKYPVANFVLGKIYLQKRYLNYNKSIEYFDKVINNSRNPQYVKNATIMKGYALKLKDKK